MRRSVQGMSQRLTLEDRKRDQPAQSPSAVGADHTAVFPSPLSTLGAIGLGSAIGFGTVYGLAALRVDPLLGVAVVVALFGVALIGLKQLTDARTEVGRSFAVAVNALAIGGTLGGFTVLV